MCGWRNLGRTSERLNRRARSLASSRSDQRKKENHIIIVIIIEATPMHSGHSRKLDHQRMLVSTAVRSAIVRVIVVVPFRMSKSIQVFVLSDRRRIASYNYHSFVLIYPRLCLTDFSPLILVRLFASHHNRITSNTSSHTFLCLIYRCLSLVTRCLSLRQRLLVFCSFLRAALPK